MAMWRGAACVVSYDHNSRERCFVMYVEHVARTRSRIVSVHIADAPI